MKKLINIFVVLLFAGISSTVYAQDSTKSVGQELKEGAKHTGKAIKKGAKKVGNETAEVASKGKATITDETYKDKVGPNGETVYIDNHSKYYWIDEKGHRHYAKKEELKAKSE